MARFRIETIDDPATGMVLVEAFSDPGDAPVARSEPIFHTHEEAADEIVGLIRRTWLDRAPEAVDPSLGV